MRLELFHPVLLLLAGPSVLEGPLVCTTSELVNRRFYN
ncbi:putative occludin/ELL family [Synechococcus sp. WH 8109]|nr:putative occludin/ELL family [Synechococcus sp. WH 8109]